MALFCSMLFIFLANGSTYADLWVPSIFRDNMVLQSDRSVPVWGEADTGSKITVGFAGQLKKTTADGNGKWKICFDPMDASFTPRTLKVSSSVKNQKLEVKNVLVGEVWILAGQSNMGWALGRCEGGPEAVSQADYPWLRVFKQWPTQGACDEPAKDVKGGQWVTCTPKYAAELSGVGFFFARALKNHLSSDTPIALINTGMGGTYAESWLSLDRIEKNSPLRAKQARDIASGNYTTNFWGENYFRRPSALYNGKVAPVQPFAARGVIWYQGEGDSAYWAVEHYNRTLTSLINCWRDGWGLEDLPFFIIQLPRYDAGAGSNWPELRAAQEKTARGMENVELVVTIDCGEKEHIHPADKQPVGERLALMARAKVYGENIPCEGPFFQTLETSDSEVYITFSNSDGLHMKGTGGFEICGADGNFVPAEVEVLQDGRAKVFSPGVPKPSAVRYAWFNWGEVSLFNGLGLPVAPFTTLQ